MAQFFPNLIFAWTFCAILCAMLTLACIVDVRTLHLPKSLTVTLFLTGIIASMLRGGMMAHLGISVFLLDSSSVIVGAFDGLLFALFGAIVGFAIFFVLFACGTCGGGDVKLFTALGAWIGAVASFWVLVVSIPLVACYVLVIGVIRLFVDPRKIFRMKPAPVSTLKGAKRRGSIVLNFSVPLSIACVLVCGWMFRYDLKLAKPMKLQEVSRAR